MWKFAINPTSFDQEKYHTIQYHIVADKQLFVSRLTENLNAKKVSYTVGLKVKEHSRRHGRMTFENLHRKISTNKAREATTDGTLGQRRRNWPRKTRWRPPEVRICRSEPGTNLAFFAQNPFLFTSNGKQKVNTSLYRYSSSSTLSTCLRTMPIPSFHAIAWMRASCPTTK